MRLSSIKLGRIIAASIVGALGIWLGNIAIKLELAAHQAPKPEAILVLGGGIGREETAAILAKNDPTLVVWVSSSERPSEDKYAIFQAAEISLERVYLDYQATDTVTNFTTLVAQFKRHQIRHLYVVTSDFHMPRAQVIGSIVLGHSGMTFTPITMPTNERTESWLRIARDGSRSMLWTITGKTGEQIGRKIEAKLSQMTANHSNH